MMIGIHQAATVNPAAQEVNAEVSGKLVLLDGALSVGHAVHRGGDPATVDIDDDRPPLPAPSAVNLASVAVSSAVKGSESAWYVP